MRFACLGSGSEGNGLVVEAGTTRLLIDCGFGVRDTVVRLGRIGIAPESVTAIIVTHEHTDHIGGVAAFAMRYGTPVWLTFGTLATVAERFADLPQVRGFDAYDVFAIDAIEVRPFPVPHDAREPVQFVCSDGEWRLGVLTDLGVSTAHVEASPARSKSTSAIAGRNRFPPNTRKAPEKIGSGRLRHRTPSWKPKCSGVSCSLSEHRQPRPNSRSLRSPAHPTAPASKKEATA